MTRPGFDNSGSDINWSHYSPFFRELDMAAFKILSYDTVKIGSKGTWADELGDPKLRPPELRFLLTDLSSKLQHVLGNTVKKGPFGAGPETASLKSAGFNKIDRLGAEQVWSLIQSISDLYSRNRVGTITV